MDRFSAADNDFQDDVPKNPMSKFIPSGFAPASHDQGQKFAKVEIQASKNQQKTLQAKMQPSSGLTTVPSWAGIPPPGSFVKVMKGGATVDRVSLSKAMTVLGRGQTADYVLDHQSISRQHAAICYQKGSGKWFVMDLRSVHGTILEGKAVKGQPAELEPGKRLQLGGSTRVFSLEMSAVPTQSTGLDSGRSDNSQAEPQPAGPGRFENAVQESYINRNSSPKGGSTRKPSQAKGDLSRRLAIVQPLKSGLYDYLPPPEQRESDASGK